MPSVSLSRPGANSSRTHLLELIQVRLRLESPAPLDAAVLAPLDLRLALFLNVPVLDKATLVAANDCVEAVVEGKQMNGRSVERLE